MHVVVILEKSDKLLAKVKISGGGRCNITHACYDIRELAKFYPRGSRELLSPLQQFNVYHTLQWFEQRGVKIKAEEDGRMFPVSDSSQTIIDCFLKEARDIGIKIYPNCGAKQILPEEGKWRLTLSNGRDRVADAIILCSSSSPAALTIMQKLGQPVQPQVPSLFTFHIADKRIADLPGVSLPLVDLSVPALKLKTSGALLITHWGMSGPAILRMSAWGARAFAEVGYHFELHINFCPGENQETIKAILLTHKSENNIKNIWGNHGLQIPARLWKTLCEAAQIPDTLIWAHIRKEQIQALAIQLTDARFYVRGKSSFKDEFVTAGGIDLKKVDLRRMQSKLFPGLFFAGEIVDIDAITGGFNFQAAWTTGWIAGSNALVR